MKGGYFLAKWVALWRKFVYLVPEIVLAPTLTKIVAMKISIRIGYCSATIISGGQKYTNRITRSQIHDEATKVCIVVVRRIYSSRSVTSGVCYYPIFLNIGPVIR